MWDYVAGDFEIRLFVKKYFKKRDFEMRDFVMRDYEPNPPRWLPCGTPELAVEGSEISERNRVW